ncbi:MAG: mannose-1-phosphate guanylyltransferase [Gemmatimonadales bacterium]
MSIWAAILAGGAGVRFWPLSTPDRPKQLLPLVGSRPLLVEAVERLRGLVPPERILILTGPLVADRIAETVPQVPRDQILIEPRAASTGPALVWAAQRIAAREPSGGAQMLSLHADWAVGDDVAFRAAATHALAVAREHDVLVTVGVKPTRNETGYGYIVPGPPLGSARQVRRFVEKPSAARAAVLRRRGGLWNTGLFAWGVARFLGEAAAHARELRAAWPALAAGDLAGFFAAAHPVAVDIGVLERTKRLAVVAGTFRWDDIGSWDALLRIRPRDARGNVVVGNVRLGDDVRDSVVWAENEDLTVLGVAATIVVRANGHTLVMPTGRGEHLKRLLQGGSA